MTALLAPLRFWIDLTMECNRRDHTPSLTGVGNQRGPFLSARAQGLALAALHDGNALAQGHFQILGPFTTQFPLGVNPIVAAAAACHEVLTLRYPAQDRYLKPAWADWLTRTRLADPVAVTAGRTLGQEINNRGSADGGHARPADPFAPQTGDYMPSGPYTHRAPPTDPRQKYAGHLWGNATRLIGVRPPLETPPVRDSNGAIQGLSPHYQSDFAKVAEKGVIDRSLGTRNLEEETIGIFWGYDGPQEIGTPPRLYMQVVLAVLDQLNAAHPGKIDLEAGLTIVAAVAVAMADAGIDAWHYKYSPKHMMWRPAIGIPHALGGNGTPNPDWVPFGRPDTNGSCIGLTPDFPAYPSGHATFGAAAFQLLRLFLVEKGLAKFTTDGIDDISFDFVSDEYNGRNRDPRSGFPRDPLNINFPSLWRAIIDNSVSRVYLGVHWQFDGVTTRSGGTDVFGIPNSPAELGQTGGVWLGGQIANQIGLHIGVSQPTINASKF